MNGTDHNCMCGYDNWNVYMCIVMYHMDDDDDGDDDDSMENMSRMR